MINTRRHIIFGIISIFIGIILSFILLELFLVLSKKNTPDRCQSLRERIAANYDYSSLHQHYKPNHVMPLCNDIDFKEFYLSDENGYLGFDTINKNSSLLVFGDSFAYGYGVNQHETIAAQLGAYNAGLWGRSFNDHVKVFDKITKKHKFKNAIWFIYAPHLISITPQGWNTKTISKDAHSFLYDIVELYNKTETSGLILKLFGIGWNRGDYYTPEWSLYDSKDKTVFSGYQQFSQAVKEVKKISKERSINIYFLIIPSKIELRLLEGKHKPLFALNKSSDPYLPSKKLTSIITKQGIEKNHIIYARELFKSSNKSYTGWEKYYFKEDAHLNAAGSQKLSEHLSTLNLITP